MSIINDALKKVQVSGPSENSPAVSPPPAPSSQPAAPEFRGNVLPSPNSPKPPPPPAKKKTSWQAWVILIVLLAAVGFVYKTPLQKMLSSGTAKARRISMKGLLPAKSVQNPPTARPLAKGETMVSGIMTMNNRQVALINGEVYEVGDVIDGMTITAITLDRVDVQQGGQTKTLRIGR